MMNWTKIPRCAAGVLPLLVAACGQAPQAAAPAAAPQVTVLAMHHADVPISTELPGRTAPYQVAQIRARADGIVQQRSFVEGSDVSAGQQLYRIDPAPYRATLASAEALLQKQQATLAVSNIQLERYQQLVGSNAVSKQVYDNAVAAQGQAAADVAAAKAALDTARINLGYTTVTAPIAGRIATSLVTQGAYVQANSATLLTTVEQLDPIYVDLQQSSAEGLRLRRALASGELHADAAGQIAVKLRLEDGSEYERTGTLQFSGVAVDTASGSVTLRALFRNPHHLLLPGMFVRASVSQGVQPNAMLVPAASLTRDRQGHASVLVVGADQKVLQRQVQTSSLVEGSWVVDSGLADGEQVIVAGLQKVKPGMTVRAVAAQAMTAGGATPAKAADHG
jgi:membrane fusion protein (multidrug efflux system)